MPSMNHAHPQAPSLTQAAASSTWPPVATVPGQLAVPLEDEHDSSQALAEAADPSPAETPADDAPSAEEEARDRVQQGGPEGPDSPTDHPNQSAGDVAPLLDELRAAIGRYVVLPSPEALTAVTLWVAASHTQPVLEHAPRLAIVGPTKGCGKSRLMDVLHETVHEPMMTVNTSPSVIFRIIGKNPPTLLVDEADTIFGPKAGDQEALRGLLNAGHQRRRPAWRVTGPEHTPTPFPTFAMAALAGIGDLPDTIMDRAIVIRMQKRKPGERISPFRSRDAVPKLNALRRRLATALTPRRAEAARLVPPMPVEDRAADTWEPLIIIADMAGAHWPELGRAACLAMTRHEVGQDAETTLRTRLLRDIRRIFADRNDAEALPTADIIAALLQDADAPWAEHGTKGLSSYHLGHMLRDFGIKSANHRFERGRQAKGYARNQFLDAWARYCPEPTTPASPAEAAQHPAPSSTPPRPTARPLPPPPPGMPGGPTRAR